MFMLESAYLDLVLQGQTDVVQAVKQALLVERFDFKFVTLTVGPRDGLGLEVYADHRPRRLMEL